MTHIFISYSVKNGDYAHQLATKLRGEGFDVWIDNARLRSSQDWWRSIVLALWDCAAFVVILTPESDTSEWVQREITIAYQRGKPVFPVLRSGDLNTPNWQIFVRTQVEFVTDGSLPPEKFYETLANHAPRKHSTGSDITALAEHEALESIDSELAEAIAQPPTDEVTQLDGGVKTASARGRNTGQLVWAAIATLIVVMGIGALIRSNQGENTLTPDSTQVVQQTTATATDTLTSTPSATATVSPVPTTPLSPTDVENTVQAEIRVIETQAVETDQAYQTTTPAAATVVAQQAIDADATQFAHQTATATLWTPTATPDTRKTAEARVTLNVISSQTQAALDMTATADSWTDTPTATFTLTPTATHTPSHTFTPTVTPILTILQRASTPVVRNSDWTPVEQEFGGVRMVLVPAGCFEMGSTDGSDNEKPVERQCIDKPFWIDKYEVRNGQFQQLGGVAASRSQWTDTNRPRENITWLEARNYCEQKRSGRLPTEKEWEYAARGPDNLIYPWGNEFVAENVVYSGNSSNQTATVGNRPGGVSWVGALDLSGNVWEWVSSLYLLPYPYDPMKAEDLDDRRYRVVRGGSWFVTGTGLRAAYRGSLNPTDENSNLGFRCARSSS
jgi:formylglycine-generating enzyme required for sulfatase activity